LNNRFSIMHLPSSRGSGKRRLSETLEVTDLVCFS
jgi:hypothetical protein